MRTSHLILRACAIALATCIPAALSLAQDTIAVPRHVLSLDLARLRPFTRSYDMVVHVGDSAQVIGQRDIAFSAAVYAGQPAWLMTETRTGIVPSFDSLFFAADMRPVHWSSALGRSRLGAEFSGDSVFGATITPAARRSIILVGRPDLLVSAAMIEVIAGLLPLGPQWSDSAALISVDAGDASVVPAELAVTGEEAAAVNDSTGGRWILAIRTEHGQLQLWVEKAGGAVVHMEQTLPAHVGSRLEYRLRPLAANPSPP